jgi:hypothetical protein
MAEVGEMFINEGLAAARGPFLAVDFLAVDTKVPARCMVNADVGTSRHLSGFATNHELEDFLPKES